jgi:hypothetical protein
MRRALPALSVALLLVVAGCSAPLDAGGGTAGDATPDETTAATGPTGETPTPETTTATTTGPAPTTTPPTETTTDDGPADDRVEVREGSLPVDAGAVYARVQELTDLRGEDVEVIVEEPSDRSGGSYDPDGFEPLGLTGGDIEDVDCGPIASASAGGDRVRIVTEGLSAAEVELVLAHEFVHTLQNDNDLRAPRELEGRESRYLRTALIEGGAVYVADQYAQRYDLTWSGDRRPLDLRECFYDDSPGGLLSLTSVYHFGGQYFAGAVDDPTALDDAYEDLPTTTEGLLHGETADGDSPRPLSVEVAARDWRSQNLGRHGELVTRIALRTELAESRAASAAEGWGNDDVVALERAGSEGYVWVHRWDDSAEAEEFREAAATYADRRRDAGVAMRVVRVGPETTALVFGDGALVEAADVETGGDGEVTVTVSDAGSKRVTAPVARQRPTTAVLA